MRIVQLSDLHLTARPGARAWRSDVWSGLRRTLAALETVAPFERLVLSGDLANRPTRAAYARLREALKPWIERVRVVPGNHDGLALVRASFADRMCEAHAGFVDRLASWRLIGLDSKRWARVHGRIGSKQLDWLRAELATDAAPTLLFLHHPCVPIGTWWLDRDVVRDAPALAEVIRKSPVQAVFCGHVHQSFTGSFAGIALHTCPSTAYQFRPGSTRPGAVESRDSGLRVIDVDGATVRTHVLRVTEAGAVTDWESSATLLESHSEEEPIRRTNHPRLGRS